jgi:hypothetical protein
VPVLRGRTGGWGAIEHTYFVLMLDAKLSPLLGSGLFHACDGQEKDVVKGVVGSWQDLVSCWSCVLSCMPFGTDLHGCKPRRGHAQALLRNLWLYQPYVLMMTVPQCLPSSLASEQVLAICVTVLLRCCCFCQPRLVSHAL